MKNYVFYGLIIQHLQLKKRCYNEVSFCGECIAVAWIMMVYFLACFYSIKIRCKDWSFGRICNTKKKGVRIHFFTWLYKVCSNKIGWRLWQQVQGLYYWHNCKIKNGFKRWAFGWFYNWNKRQNGVVFWLFSQL
jgi:hypothetical protein